MSTTVTITGMNQAGYGTSTSNEEVITAPYTAVGDIVEVEYNAKSSFHNIVRFIRPSLQRVKPACQHFGTCGGCTLQHLSDQEYIKFKHRSITQSLNEVGIQTDCVEDVVIIGPGQRRRIDIEVKKYPKETVMGFHERGRRRLVNIIQCPVVHPQIESILKPLHNLFAKIMTIGEKIHIFITQANQGLDILFAGLRRCLTDEEKEHLQKFAQDYSLARLQVKVKKTYDFQFIHDIPTVNFGDIPVEISAHSFLQASAQADKCLSKLVLSHLSCGIKKIADLYSGRGTFSLPLAQAGYQVSAFEGDKNAIKALQATNHPNIIAQCRDLFSDPLSKDELKEFDVLVVDPPRTGLQQQLNHILCAQVPSVIYISCSPPNFAQDAKQLIQGGYTLSKLYPVDQFHWTAHMEVVGIFHKA